MEKEGKMALFRMMVLALAFAAGTAMANEVEIVHTTFTFQNGAWHVSTTLRHNDTGWDHYADAWQVVDGQGQVLGKRVLYHPHENEQPFTRSDMINIPADVGVVYVEAHDKVDGWSKQRVRVELDKAKGDRFEVRR
jgi:hypothetical protein